MAAVRRVVRMTMGLAVVAAAVLVAVVLVAASGSRAAWDSCPRQEPSAPGSSLRRVPLIRFPARPVAAVACGYDDVFRGGAVRSRHPRVFRVRMTTAVAERLVSLLLDNRGSAAHSCADDAGVVVRIRYARAIVRSVAATGCKPEELWSGRRAETLRGPAAETVGGLFSLPIFAGDRTVPEPAVVGKPLAAARVAGGPGWIVEVGELLDPHVPLGSVLWQSPLPGSPIDPGTASVDVLVAVPPARTCRSPQLRGAYLDGGNGTGDHYGNVILFDPSRTPCTVAGRLTLAGLDRSGRVVTGPASEVLRSLVLSPGQRVPPTRGSGLLPEAGFGGGGIGYCEDIRRRVIEPLTWRVRVGAASVRFPNVPYVTPDSKAGPFYSCEGGISFGISGSAGLMAFEQPGG